MKRPAMILVISSVVVVLLLAGAYVLYSASGQPARTSLSGVVTNESYINGLYHDLDVSDVKAVFRYVFTNLENEVTVYPSENYYYFKFTAAGKTYTGSISLPAERIDRGIISVGYTIKPEDRTRQKYFRTKGGSHDFTEDDGLVVDRISGFRYRLTYEGKSVIFNLFDGGLEPPKKAKLRSDEVYVGPSFDDSGLQFFLIFNKTVNKLYWVLNEEEFAPEKFTKYTPNVVIGDRTEFAFYVDSVNNRKIMVGVEGLNVLHNGWFDGPFDQMPDNYVKAGKIQVKKYLVAHYGFSEDMIDKYGKFNSQDNTRLPVAPYRVYFDRNELKVVDSLKALNRPMPEFYAAITEQVYSVPKNFYEGVLAK